MSKYLDVAIEAVKIAEKVIIEYYDSEKQIATKADNSPVTIADKMAEAKMREYILAHFPEHKVYGEEGEKSANEQDEFVWVIDPIDGTKNFIRGIPLFGTLLALMKDGEVVVGVSNMPFINECMYAEKDGGAFLNGKRVRVSSVENIQEAYCSYGSTKYFTQRGLREKLLGVTERMRWARGIGDCWSYHLLAQGKLDSMVEAHTKLWDVAPLKLIVEEAGGKMTQIDGSPIDFSTATALASNGLLHEEMLMAFK